MKFFHLASIPHVVNVRCASGGFVCDSVSVMFTQPNRESARVLAFAQQVRVEKTNLEQLTETRGDVSWGWPN